MSWIYLIVGIGCLVVLQSLRTALSTEFPLSRSFPAGPPDPCSFGGMDLIDAKTETLSKLGFDGPVWVGSEESSSSTDHVTAHAVYRNDREHIVAWVGSIYDFAQPGQLLTYYTTLLMDGRYALTQVNEPFFALVDDPLTPAQTIAPSDEATEIDLHKQFVATLDIAPARSSSQADIFSFAGEHMTNIRSRLLERGRISESAGIARPSLSFAISILRAIHTRPKGSAPEAAPIPTSRLSFLANLAERVKSRTPSQGMQYLLLLISSVLFIFVGWPFLGLEFTLIILGVIAFHEAGHWAAMRMFGYRNPHITLLPLLGGVTIGYEMDPDAAKRAWVALAGPLPGIVIAWALIYLAGFTLTNIGEIDGWILSTLIVLLFINYLNVLPIPPLDGSHIVQSILPPRWLVVQTLFILIGVALSFYVAYLLEFWPLALIAALQLPGLKSVWRTAALVRRFSTSPPPPELEGLSRTAWLLAKLEEILGAPKTAAKRIALASNILTQLDTRPMGKIQGTVVSSIYLALVVVPVAALILVTLERSSQEHNPEVESMLDAYQADHEALKLAAVDLDSAELLAAFSEEDTPSTPASEASIAAAEARLGRPLPAHLREFYELRNGVPAALGLGRVEDIRVADPETFQSEDILIRSQDGAFRFYNAELEEVIVPVTTTRGWWDIGSSEYWQSHVYLNPNAMPGEPAIFDFDSYDTSAFRTMHEFLEAQWIEQQSMEIYDEHAARMNTAVAESMRDLNAVELIAKFPRQSIIARLVSGTLGEPGPAEPGALTAAETKTGHVLPADYRQTLEVHNGFAPMALLPIEDILPAAAASEENLQAAFAIADSAQPGLFTEQELAACWIIGGRFAEVPGTNAGAELYVSILWCPELDEEHRYLTINGGGFRSSFTELLRERVILFSTL